MASFAIIFTPTDTALIAGVEPKAWFLDAPHFDAAKTKGKQLATDHLAFKNSVTGEGDNNTTLIYADVFETEACGTVRILERQLETMPLAA